MVSLTTWLLSSSAQAPPLLQQRRSRERAANRDSARMVLILSMIRGYRPDLDMLLGFLVRTIEGSGHTGTGMFVRRRGDAIARARRRHRTRQVPRGGSRANLSNPGIPSPTPCALML